MSNQSNCIDPRGDVSLKIKTPEKEVTAVFLACSRALARASPVFDRMLYGNFAEAKSNNSNTTDWIVKLEDEKPAPMETFLNLAHSNFARIPKTFSIDNLYDLVVLTHYYDATHLLAPWIETWLSSVGEIVRDASDIMSKMIWITWELGRKEQFTIIARRMLMEAKEPWPSAADDSEAIQAPPYIIGIQRINAVRNQTIQELLDIIRDMVGKLIIVDEQPRWCRHATWMGHHRCESMLLGSMTFCLARAGLWPVPEVSLLEMSLVDLHRTLTSLIIHDIGETSEKPVIDHRECNPGPYLLDKVQRVMSNIPSTVTDYHFKCLDERAKSLK
ncbi:nuclear pore protein-like protein [Pochonia chlamydosporia 170]|uniref:Nuclear pore protein-like protein n=1 Tax=Pochonia chlamydosporia 170 TaxID=1380566 RepID=A0A179FXK3_METCM|nr:nuclear pore protein-like protein [Pochonia chlamydosporia 170]OAQ69831.2 nuclear pore protein-like protein [Pochonia chlamydosporia 170]